MEVFWYKQ